MNREQLLRQFKNKAEQDRELRRDPRFVRMMGFLVAKGFLKTNFEVHPFPNLRLRIADVLWAGENIEPRILEVLPAAILRLGKHFDLDGGRYPELALVVDQLRAREKEGASFRGMPYEKMKVWADLPLRDKRVKAIAKRKVSKTFRLEPEIIDKLRALAVKSSCSETEVLETLIRRFDLTG